MKGHSALVQQPTGQVQVQGSIPSLSYFQHHYGSKHFEASNVYVCAYDKADHLQRDFPNSKFLLTMCEGE